MEGLKNGKFEYMYIDIYSIHTEFNFCNFCKLLSSNIFNFIQRLYVKFLFF